MKTNSIIDIELSPFWISELFPYFFYGYNKTSINLSVVNLIIPFVLTKSIRESILLNANSNSSFNSLFLNTTRRNKNLFTFYDDSLINDSCLHDMQQKYLVNKELTGKALIIAYEKKYIDFKNGSIVPIELHDYRTNNDPFLRDFYKSANNLGIVFKSEEIKSLFLKCNIQQL